MFTPRPERYAVVREDAVSGRRAEARADWQGAEDAAGRDTTGPAPLPPMVETIPTPEPDADQGWKARSPGQPSDRPVSSGSDPLPSPNPVASDQVTRTAKKIQLVSMPTLKPNNVNNSNR